MTPNIQRSGPKEELGELPRKRKELWQNLKVKMEISFTFSRKEEKVYKVQYVIR